jgi:hypothetical protein
VYISNIKQVYLPFQELQLGLLGKEYSMRGIENTDKMLGDTSLGKCSICESYIFGGGIVCNSCGALVHGPRFLDSHGFTCKKCGKTICRDCTYNGGIIHKLCRECAQESGIHLDPLTRSMHQRLVASGGFLCLGGLSYFADFNIILGIVFVTVGLGILVLDYRGKAPPYEII